jgi:mono/diheme cytochrome c family protein
VKNSGTRLLVITTLFLTLSSCGNHDPQPTFKAFEGNSARLPPEGTVAYTEKLPPLDRHGYPQGMKLDQKKLIEGEELFQRNCTACHGWNGQGDGIAVKRGLTPPPSFMTKALKESRPLHFVDVMTHGKGRMPSYARRLTREERWKVAAYVKALQLSQDISVKKLMLDDREKLP